jgi:hypothetical protein
LGLLSAFQALSAVELGGHGHTFALYRAARLPLDSSPPFERTHNQMNQNQITP